jgi:AraC family transcriptional regulator
MGQATDALLRPTAARYIAEGLPARQIQPTRPRAPFPVPHAFSPAEDAPEEADRSPQPTAPIGIIINLLERAADAVDTDRSAAKDCILRAAALLEAGQNRADSEYRSRTQGFVRGGLTPRQMKQLARHIDAAMGSSISTEECASIARLSTSHFRRAFKASFGETFSAYLSRRRVERAQEMMVMTNQPLCRIARQCGFADQSHFTRVFRRLVGPSPGSWRRL